MTKKSQITMFVILGLVLLIVVVMFFGFIKELKEKPTSVKKIIDELETGRLNNHVTTCTATVAAEGLEKLGANGGVIYNFDGGNIVYDPSVLGTDYLGYDVMGQTYYVAYGLRKNTLCNAIDHSIFRYPSPGASIDQLNQIYSDNCELLTSQSDYDGIFGHIALKKLCILARQFEQPSCESFANGEVLGLTIQAQLEDYIKEKLPLCIDFEEFTKRLDANVTVDSTPIVETNIHDSEILFTVKYPITISFDNKEPITQLISYQTTLNVRLARVYNFLHNALLHEAKMINVNIDDVYNLVDVYYKEGIELTRIRAPCTSCPLPYKYDDIIEVVDRNSNINGKPFVFRVAIENRRPVLEPIPNQETSVVNADLIIPLRAQDPDDTTINYIFLSSSYGHENCGEGAGRLGVGAGGPGYGHGSTWNFQGFPSDSYGAINWCSVNLNPIPSGSPSVLSIPITEFDYGKHRVGILAIDETGLFDYQEFNISITYPVASFAPDPCRNTCIDGDYGLYVANGYASLPPPFYNPSSGLNDIDGYCDKWCEIAANPCSNWCDFTNIDTDPYPLFWDSCRACVLPIISSEQTIWHDCQGFNYDTAACIANMPKCFLISEKNRYDDSFYETCYDIGNFGMINDFDTTNNPAFIITSTAP